MAWLSSSGKDASPSSDSMRLQLILIYVFRLRYCSGFHYPALIPEKRGGIGAVENEESCWEFAHRISIGKAPTLPDELAMTLDNSDGCGTTRRTHNCPKGKDMRCGHIEQARSWICFFPSCVRIRTSTHVCRLMFFSTFDLSSMSRILCGGDMITHVQ